MGDSNPKNGDGYKISVDLLALRQSFVARLQYLLELLNFGFVSSARVNSADYGPYDQFLTVSFGERLMSFDLTVDEARRWYLTNGLRDAIEVVNAFLEQCRTICALVDAVDAQDIDRVNAAIDSEARRFHKHGLPRKIEILREQYGVSSFLDSHVISINSVRNCLVHRSGIVSHADVNEHGELKLLIRSMGAFAENEDLGTERPIDREGAIIAPGEKVYVQLGEYAKVFHLDERIDLSYPELYYAFWSVFDFILSITVAVENYARDRIPGAFPSQDPLA
jgi:hypothetical protein